MRDRLDKFDVLSELSSEERELLADFLDEVQVRDGMSVYQRGQESEELLLIGEGRVRVEHDGQPQGSLPAGEALGGVGLVVIGTRAASAFAEGDTALLSLSRERYLRLRSEQPAIAMKLVEGLLQGIAAASRRLVS